MAKFIFTGDWHLSSIGIKTRIDNYSFTCLDKLNQLVDLAKEQTANSIICPGDIFHANNISAQFFADLFDILDNALSLGITFYLNVGNHDVSNAVTHTWKVRQLRQLSVHPAIKVISGVTDINGVSFGFYNAYSDLPLGNYDVCVSHHFCIDSFNDELVLYPSALKETVPSCKLLLAGHDHSEYPIYEDSGITVVRPGSLLRTSSAEHNNRTPAVYIWDSDKGYSQEAFTKYPLRALPYNDIFLTNLKQAEKETDSAIDKFISRITTGVTCKVNVTDVIKAQLELLNNEDQQLIKQDLIANGFEV